MEYCNVASFQYDVAEQEKNWRKFYHDPQFQFDNYGSFN